MYGMGDKIENMHLESPNKSLLFMRHFYNEINGIAKEITFMPLMHIDFSFLPVRAIQTRLLNGESIDHIADTVEKVESYMPITRRYLELIECNNCIKVNWSNLWCGDGVCRVVDENQILLFVDDNHVSLYGSMYLGEYLYKLYIDYVGISQ
jgi:hypothetical protein